MPVDPARAVLLASGIAMVCLAACVFAIDPRRTLHRAFAALLAVRGLAVLLPQASNDEPWAWAAANTQPVFALALLPLALYCSTLDPRPGAVPRRSLGWWTLAAIAALEVFYWADHSLFQTLQPGTGGGASQAAEGVRYVAFGPLAAVAACAGIALAVAGLRFAFHYRIRPRGPEARAVLLLAAAFLLGGLFDGASRLVALVDLLDSGASFPWLPWGWAVMVLPACAAVPALLGVVVLQTGERRPQGRAELWVLGVSFVAVGAGLLRLAVPPNPDPAGDSFQLVLAGFARLLMPAGLAVALLAGAATGFGTRFQETFAWCMVTALLAVAALASGVLAAGRIDTPFPVAAAVGAAVAATLALPVLNGSRAFARWAIPARHPAPGALGAEFRSHPDARVGRAEPSARPFIRHSLNPARAASGARTPGGEHPAAHRNPGGRGG